MTTTKINRGEATKLKFLQAAKKTLLKDGIGSLTVDMLCEKAGVSKGAFFHHFKSRDDLLIDLMKHLTEYHANQHADLMDKDKLAFGKGLRAYIQSMLCLSGEDRENARAICRCMVEILFTDPDLLKQIGLTPGYYDALLADDFLGGMSREQALIILLASEGLWYDQSLGLCGIRKNEVSDVVDLLIDVSKKRLAL